MKKERVASKAYSVPWDESVWPQERDVFERPHRYKYVRKLIRPKGCVFCHCAKSKQLAEDLVVLKGRYLQVVLNKYPYNNGHLLILPRRHVGELDLLKKSESSRIQSLLTDSMKILKKVYQPQGFNVGLNQGAVAGAGIPDHLHYHLIPRWGGDTNFFPLIAETKLVIETTEITYEKLRPSFKKIEKKNVY